MTPQETQEIRALWRYERERKGPPEGFPALPDLPARRYTDPAFFELEQKYFWRKSWLLAGHRDELPEPGSYKLWELGGQPVLLFHGRDGEIRAFYNLCRHRGAALVTATSGRTARLTCSYHGWTYDDKGDLVSIRDPRDFGADFDMSCRSLYSIRCECYGRLIFVNFDRDAPTLRAYLGPVWEQWEDLDFEKTRFVESYIYDLDCNWKIAMEANLEVYHVKSLHPSSVHVLLDYEQNVNVFYPRGHARMASPMRPEYIEKAKSGAYRLTPVDLPEIKSVGEIARISSFSFNVLPNIVTPVGELGFPILTFWPNGLAKTRFQVTWIGADWGAGERPKAWDARIAAFNEILSEDMHFGNWIQKAVASEVYESVPLNYQEARIYHFHQQMDALIGAERIPEPLRVTPVIGPDWIWPNGTARRLALLDKQAAG